MSAYLSPGFTASACWNTASTSSLTTAPSVRGVGRTARSQATDATALRSGVARLADRRGALGELREDGAFSQEGNDELLLPVVGEVSQEREDLERYGALPDHVPRPVDGREASGADDALHKILVGERLAE
jgi:hypothetical protein